MAVLGFSGETHPQQTDLFSLSSRVLSTKEGSNLATGFNGESGGDTEIGEIMLCLQTILDSSSSEPMLSMPSSSSLEGGRGGKGGMTSCGGRRGALFSVLSGGKGGTKTKLNEQTKLSAAFCTDISL